MAKLGLPSISTNLPPDLRGFLDRVADYLRSATFVTKEELVAAGVITQDQYGQTLGGDPGTVDYTPPPAPTNLAAAPAITSVLLTWDAPAYSNHAYTEILVAVTNNLGTAVVGATAIGNVYSYAVEQGSTHYFWVRFVSKAQVEGPVNATSGVAAVAALSPSWVLGNLAGAITSSELATALSTKISLIDAADTVSGSVNARVKAASDSLQAQINTITNTPAYDNTHTYSVNDQVTYSGGIYRALGTTTGNLPTDATYWQKIGDYTSLGAAVADHSAKIDAINTVSAGSTSAAAQAIAGLQAATTDSTSGLAALSARIIAEQTARTSADTAFSSSLSSLSAQVNDPSTGLANAHALINTESSTRSTQYSTLASQYTTLSTTVSGNTTSIATNTSSINGLMGLYTLKIDNNGVVSGFGLSSTLTAGGSVTSNFLINADNFAVMAPSGALGTWAASNTYAASTCLSGSGGLMLVCKIGGISNSSTAPSLAGKTVGDLIVDGTVTWQVASRTPLVLTTTTQTVNGVTVPPGLYLDGAFITNATIGSAQIQDAAITNAKIGAAAVGTANIADAAITTAKIATAAIDTAQIKTAAITTAVIADAAITNAKIADATIGFAKIANDIQSTNYSAGTTGWKIDKTGTIEANSATIRGTVYASAGTFSGALQAATGTFTGELSGATGTFNGQLMAGVLDFSAVAGTTQTFATNGSVTVPAGRDKMRVTLQGPGGGGGGSNTNNFRHCRQDGYGGNAGDWIQTTFSVTPGDTYNIEVGVGGAPGTGGSADGSYATNGSAGGTTRFKTSGGATLLSANGGTGGSSAPNGSTAWYLWVQDGSRTQAQASRYGAGGYEESTAGIGAGGSGGWAANDPADYGGPGVKGGDGYAIVEFFTANSVVLRTEFSTLTSALQRQGIAVT